MADETNSEEYDQPIPVPEEGEELANPEPEPAKKESSKSPKSEAVKDKPKSGNEINPYAFRRFMKKVLAVRKKHKKKIKAHESLRKHVQKLKEKPIATLTDKKKFKRGLEGIEQRISAVLAAERQLLGIEKEDLDIVKDLKQEIIDLKKELSDTKKERDKQLIDNKRTIRELNEVLTILKGKLGIYMDKKLKREERINELETKIKSTPLRKHELIAAKRQLEDLEIKYAQLSKKPYRKEKLEQIREKIDMLKDRLAGEI